MKSRKLSQILLIVLLALCGISNTSYLEAKKNKDEKSTEGSKKDKKDKKDKKNKNDNDRENKNSEEESTVEETGTSEETEKNKLKQLRNEKKDLRKKLKDLKYEDRKAEKEALDKNKIEVQSNTLKHLKQAQKSLKYKDPNEALKLINKIKNKQNDISRLNHQRHDEMLEEKIAKMERGSKAEEVKELRQALQRLNNLRTMKYSILSHIRNTPLILNEGQYSAEEKYSVKEINKMIKVGLKKTNFSPAMVKVKDRELLTDEEIELIPNKIRKHFDLEDNEEITFKQALEYVRKHLSTEIRKLISQYISKKEGKKMEKEEKEKNKKQNSDDEDEFGDI